MRSGSFILTLFAFLVLSCSVMEDDKPEANMGFRPFYAVLDQPSSLETKVYVDDDLRLQWDDDDRISIYDEYTYGYHYKYVGDSGDGKGKFECFEKVATSSFVTGADMKDTVCAVYPYVKGLQIRPSKKTYIEAFPLPAVQTYRENSLGRGANTMISMGKDENLAFKNVCGYLALKVYGGNVTVSSITLKGNNSEMIAGKADIDVSLDAAPSLRRFVDGKYSITLECEDVKVGNTAGTATVFWLVVPPTKFEKGFTVTVEYNDEKEFVQTTSRSIEIKRSCLSRMVAFGVK